MYSLREYCEILPQGRSCRRHSSAPDRITTVRVINGKTHIAHTSSTHPLRPTCQPNHDHDHDHDTHSANTRSTTQSKTRTAQMGSTYTGNAQNNHAAPELPATQNTQPEEHATQTKILRWVHALERLPRSANNRTTQSRSTGQLPQPNIHQHHSPCSLSRSFGLCVLSLLDASSLDDCRHCSIECGQTPFPVASCFNATFQTNHLIIQV